MELTFSTAKEVAWSVRKHPMIRLEIWANIFHYRVGCRSYSQKWKKKPKVRRKSGEVEEEQETNEVVEGAKMVRIKILLA